MAVSTAPMPDFVKAGGAGSDLMNSGKFVKFEAGKPVELIMLTGVEPPIGEKPNGRNCLISFKQYSIWLEAKDRPEGVMSPMFPALGGKDDPGALLGLEPSFKSLGLVMVNGTAEEQILGMGISIFKQLVDIELSLGESLRGHIIRINKKGEGKQTKYTVVATGRRVSIDGEPDLNLVEYLGPTNRADIIEMLDKAGQWPPPGGDPYAATTGKTKPAAIKPAGPKETKPVPAAEPSPTSSEPADEGDWSDELPDVASE